jgi:hypothetical protein
LGRKEGSTEENRASDQFQRAEEFVPLWTLQPATSPSTLSTWTIGMTRKCSSLQILKKELSEKDLETPQGAEAAPGLSLSL